MNSNRQQNAGGGNDGSLHPSAGLYNEEYFQTHFAVEPYGRESAHWMEFFGRVADFIVQRFRPRRVLDAGCAMGLLVEALRDRGVEAFGLDISDYALSKVREDLKPFCRKASVTDPLVEDYDLIACIEVLEHVTEEEALAAIRQFAAHAPLILFSSTPRDFTEPTHVNVQSIAYWVKAFGREALHTDLATDASVVCPHALVFSRQPHSPNDLLSFITRSFDWAVDLNELRIKAGEDIGKLLKELEQVRSGTEEARERFRVLEDQVASLRSRLQTIEALEREERKAKESTLGILKEERREKERIQELLGREREAKALALQAARQEQQGRESALSEAEGLKRRTGEFERTLSAERATNEELRNHIDLIHTSRGWKWLERFRRAKLRLVAGRRGPVSLLLAPIALARRVRKNYAFLGSQSWLDTLPFHDRKSDLSVDDWIRWIGPITMASQTRNALLMHPVSTASFRIELPRRARLYVSMGLLPGCWHKNASGVVFRVNVRDDAGNNQASAKRFVHPSRRIADRRWVDVCLDLKHLAGLKVVLELSVEVPQNVSALHAWGIWGDPVITSVPTTSRALWRLRSEVGASGVSRTIYRLLLSPRFQDRDPEFYRWISETEPAEEDLRHQREESGRLNYQPLVSIILPVHRIPVWILEETIQSVVNQTYPLWELSIAGGELSRKVRRCAESHASRDPRIKFNWLPRNLGISGNSNAALRPAQGEFVALLDHDDVLAPFALFEIVRRLNEDPELDLLYSDKDMLSPGGRRFQPLFKPRWSPAMMLSANYLTHLTVLRRSIVEEIGGFRSEMDGSQDWDLFLRFVERTSRIERVPRVLYHWRVVPTSVARSIGAKPYALAAQERAVHEHLERTGRPCSVVRCGPYLRVRWSLDRLPRVSVIVPEAVRRPWPASWTRSCR
jgi:SAM-dependent methyltransferase